MGCIAYNDIQFRKLYPNYANNTENPEWFWDLATSYVNDQNGGCFVGALTLKQQTQALNLMTAHLIFLQGAIAQGQNTGIVTGATVDKISVTLEPPPQVNQWQWWLNQTPYGQQLLSLLQTLSAGGFFINSAPPGRAGFRFSGVC